MTDTTETPAVTQSAFSAGLRVITIRAIAVVAAAGAVIYGGMVIVALYLHQARPVEQAPVTAAIEGPAVVPAFETIVAPAPVKPVTVKRERKPKARPVKAKPAKSTTAIHREVSGG